jgi:hypothetical protein
MKDNQNFVNYARKYVAGPGCDYCLEGFIPTTSPIIGHAYELCPLCFFDCPTCLGRAVWPLTLVSGDAAENLDPDEELVICGMCKGVVDIHRNSTTVDSTTEPVDDREPPW